MDLSATELDRFIRLAFHRMLEKARSAGPRVSERPPLPGANSIYALVHHCCQVTRWWLGHMICGDPITRHRAAEFQASGDLAQLEADVAALLEELPSLLPRVVASGRPVQQPPDGAEPPWPWTTSALALHVIEELFQHAGHVDLTADLLGRERSPAGEGG